MNPTTITIKRRLRFITGWLLILSAVSIPMSIMYCRHSWALPASITLLIVMLGYHVWEFIHDEREHRQKVHQLKTTIRNGRKIVHIIVLAFFALSCGPRPAMLSCKTNHWLVKRNKGIRSYTYVQASWPRDRRMATYDSGQPVKASTVRRMKSARRR